MNKNFLDLIRDHTLNRVHKIVDSEEELKEKALGARTPHDFMSVFDKEVSIIAEIKFASPSRGKISEKCDPVEVASDYLEGGASALSVLTEPSFFGGSLDNIKLIRAAKPESMILKKDFVLDPKQIYQARVYGADAVLLIVAFLGKEKLEMLYEKAIGIGLTPLVEVHDDNEMKIARSVGAKFIGVNNRNLKTLKTDIKTSISLASYNSSDVVMISESGIRFSQEINMLKKLGYRGFLMGTHFMKENAPGEVLKKILQEVSK